MDFSLSPKAFVKKYYSLKEMSGHEKFLALCIPLSGGKSGVSLTIKDVKKEWSKTVFGISFSNTYYSRATNEGWLRSVGAGKFVILDDGISYLEEKMIQGVEKIGNGSGLGLLIFSAGKTHTFDKYLRSLFSSASLEVIISDSYVDETIFDNLLDQIPSKIDIKLLYKKAQGSFNARAKRFGIQYKKFVSKKQTSIHDRFLIIYSLPGL